MVYRMVVLLALPCLVLGCSGNNPDVHRDSARAAICARSWKAKGFSFDPNTMTCAEMFERAQAIRKAAYWRPRGYAFDPDTMTAREMSRKAAELRKMGVNEYSSVPAAQRQGGETVAAEAAPAQPLIRPEDAATRRALRKMTITQVRAKYPQYDDMDDIELTEGIHDRYFADVPFGDFAHRFLGYQP